MVGRTLSKQVKKQARHWAGNSRYQDAIDEYLCEKAKPEGIHRPGLRPIADKHRVRYKTLSNLAKGGQSMSSDGSDN
jgi:uncharacterized protein (DUF885 family)